LVIEVRLYATLRAIAGQRSVAVSGSCTTVRDLLDELVERWPELEDRIYDEEREMRPYVAVMVDGRDIRHLEGLATALAADSELDVFPPVAGGMASGS
jgi:sulfur-carrier protein